ncbi:MAG: fatty acid desaturase [Sandaracinus sp.]|nr:fatty acid desaturase [Sandaracinus sp.]
MVASIVGLAVAGAHLPAWLFVPLAPIPLGILYFGCFVLVVHEASHDMFVVFRDRQRQKRWNRAFGWAVAVVFATHYGKHWEHGHREHHVRPLEPADPQQHNILVGRPLLVRVLCNLFVPGFLFLERTIFRTRRAGGKSTSTKGVILLFVGIWASALTLTSLTAGWPSALALFLGIHVLSALNQIKGALEHGGPIGHERDPFLRSRTTFFPLRRVLLPFHITLHFEHHLNFQVPWYDLPRYHRDLEAIVPPEVWRHVINRDVLAQLSGRLGGLSDDARELAAPFALPAAAE